jgi:hypothetical protein
MIIDIDRVLKRAAHCAMLTGYGAQSSRHAARAPKLGKRRANPG